MLIPSRHPDNCLPKVRSLLGLSRKYRSLVTEAGTETLNRSSSHFHVGMGIEEVGLLNASKPCLYDFERLLELCFGWVEQYCTSNHRFYSYQTARREPASHKGFSAHLGC